jgi:hypothetical protein
MASRLPALVIACAVLAGCGGDKATAPSGPIIVTALAISPPPPSLPAGRSHRFSVTATLSNGQTAIVGFAVLWTSSDVNVATVNAEGLVIARADGRTTITAAAKDATASVEVLVRGGRTILGHVNESAPTEFLQIAGARVTVVDGIYAGASATTDEGGAFSIADVNGVVNLRISAPAYVDAQATVDLARTSFATIAMRPVIPRRVDRAEFDGSRDGADKRHQFAMTFTARRSGPVELFTLGAMWSEYYTICSELRDDDNRLVWSVSKFTVSGASRATQSLQGGRRYELKVSDCGAGGQPTIVKGLLVAVHPN